MILQQRRNLPFRQSFHARQRFEECGHFLGIETGPGDYIYVPPWVPHREENPDPGEEAVVVIARTTQDAIVVNLADLTWTGPPGV